MGSDRMETDPGIEGRRAVRDLLSGYILLAAALLGAGALVVIREPFTPIAWLLFVELEPQASLAITAIIALSVTLSSQRFALERIRPIGWVRNIKPWHVALTALCVSVPCVQAVYHGFALSADEYMTRFQSEIFGAGRLAGQVPGEWRDLGGALHHSFARFHQESGTVYSNYRHGMAALYAAFDLVGLGRYTSAILTAGSILLVASVARRLWPTQRSAPLAAALILGSSSQVLITGLTAYAMSAHLFFNLLWIRLFLVDRVWAHGLAAIVGVATAALHQIHMHLFFAAPFLALLLRPLRVRLLVFYGATYALGHALRRRVEPARPRRWSRTS